MKQTIVAAIVFLVLLACGEQDVEQHVISSSKPLRYFSGHTKSVMSVAFSPDGTHVLTGSADGTAKLWHATSREVLHTFSGHTGSVLSVAFSPDGKHVLTGSADRTAKLWDASSGQVVHTLSKHTDRVWCVAFSPDGTLAASGGSTALPYYGGQAKVWDVRRGEILHTLSGPGSRVGSVLQDCSVLSIAFSPDGKRILTGSAAGLVTVSDAASGELLYVPHPLRAAHTSPVKSVAFSPDGTLLLTAGADGELKLWNMAKGTLLRTFSDTPRSVWCAAFSPDGALAAAGGSIASRGKAKVWSIATGDLLRTFTNVGAASAEYPGTVLSVAFSPDGNYLLSGHGDGSAILWDITDISPARNSADH